MQKLTNLEYVDGGTIIIFAPADLTEGETVQKFSFSVKDNEELTQKLLNSVKNKKVKEKDIYFCAKALFEKIKELNGSQNSFRVVGKVKISLSFTKKGPRGEEYYKINLIHQRGTLSKSFTLYGGTSFGTKGDWEDIFHSQQQDKYAEFLKQFGIEIPKELFGKHAEPEAYVSGWTDEDLEKFSGSFIFAEQ